MDQISVTSSGNQAQRPTSEVPEPYNSIFAEYTYFNSIQSAVFDCVFYSDDSIAVSAPTGSGKTAIFELAVARLLMNLDFDEYRSDYKIIYIAPMKALCEERLVDWHKKFAPLGVNCICVTGDSEDADYQSLNTNHLIITTPEKWDSMTRSWRDHDTVVRRVKLFMIDEIHLLNDDVRGSTLEAIITRMKTIHDPIASNADVTGVSNKLRFVGVSATVSNIEDVADWFEKLPSAAKYFKFKDEMRPVRLQKTILGYPYNPSQSTPFKFDIMLSYKLHQIILQHSSGKPTLVFCSTRKSVEMTSKQLIQNLTISLSAEQKQILTETSRTINNSKLTETLVHGVGSHHAGMLYEHRKLIENLFRKNHLPVLVTTSTLAMGVNLPAHLVVIKSTKYYSNGEYKDYNASMLFQMIGRAGRPQFDTAGIAVVMTTVADKHKYENMVSGEQPIESYLRNHLVEFINAEVVLRTITDLSVAMEWLSSTFLYIRARKNPKHYGFLTGLNINQLDKKLLEMCQIEIRKLAEVGMLTMDSTLTIFPTKIGSLMAKYCVSFETMKLFTQITGGEVLQQVLSLVSKCYEFHEIRLRSNDKSTLNLLNKCKNKQTIRFTMNGKIKTLDMKINCTIQAVLGCLKIEESWLVVEAQRVMRIGERLLQCLAEYLQTRENCFQALLNSIILAKCFHVRIWENSPYVSRQLDGIGVVFSNALVAAGKTTFKSLLDTNPRELERVMNKKPPLGNKIQEQVKLIPFYTLSVESFDETMERAKIRIIVTLENAKNFNGEMTVSSFGVMNLIVGDSENNLLLHKKIKHLHMVENPKIVQDVQVNFHSELEVFVNFISEDWVGIDAQSRITLFSDKKTNKTDTETDVKVLKSPKREPKSAKLKRTKSGYLQQSMDYYFQTTAKATVRKAQKPRKNDPKIEVVELKKDIQGETPPEEYFGMETVDSTQTGNDDQNSKMEVDVVEKQPPEINNQLFNEIGDKVMKDYLKIMNKKILSETLNSDEFNATVAQATPRRPADSTNNAEIKNKNTLGSIFLKNVYGVGKAATLRKSGQSRQWERKTFNKRKEEMNSTRALEFEASLSSDSISNLKFKYEKREKSKLGHDGENRSHNEQESNLTQKCDKEHDKRAESVKNITWKFPLVESRDVIHSPHLQNTKPQMEVLFRPNLKRKKLNYPLSDKEWLYNSQSSPGGREDAQKEHNIPLEDFLSTTALKMFGLDEKKDSNEAERELNTTISSTASNPRSVKTKYVNTVSNYVQMGSNLLAEKIKLEIPKINDEINSERLNKPTSTERDSIPGEDKKCDSGNELKQGQFNDIPSNFAGTKVEVMEAFGTPRPCDDTEQVSTSQINDSQLDEINIKVNNGELKRRSSWEEEFLSNDFIDPFLEQAPFENHFRNPENHGYNSPIKLEDAALKRTPLPLKQSSFNENLLLNPEPKNKTIPNYFKPGEESTSQNYPGCSIPQGDQRASGYDRLKQETRRNQDNDQSFESKHKGYSNNNFLQNHLLNPHSRDEADREGFPNLQPSSNGGGRYLFQDFKTRDQDFKQYCAYQNYDRMPTVMDPRRNDYHRNYNLDYYYPITHQNYDINHLRPTSGGQFENFSDIRRPQIRNNIGRYSEHMPYLNTLPLPSNEIPSEYLHQQNVLRPHAIRLNQMNNPLWNNDIKFSSQNLNEINHFPRHYSSYVFMGDENHHSNWTAGPTEMRPRSIEHRTAQGEYMVPQETMNGSFGNPYQGGQTFNQNVRFRERTTNYLNVQNQNFPEINNSRAYKSGDELIMDKFLESQQMNMNLDNSIDLNRTLTGRDLQNPEYRF